jgi:PKD repeat protein
MPVIRKRPEGKTESEVKNKIALHELRNLPPNAASKSADPVLQGSVKAGLNAPMAPIQNFDGISNTYGVYPPDTQGDVGPNNYIQVVNLGFQIFSKTGVSQYGPANLSTIWAGIPAPWNGTNNGDPIVLYDQAADRWMIAQFSLPNTTQYAMLMAISQTPDPTGAWYRYVYEFGNKMPDYPKFGVWPDGYYMAVNQFTGGTTWAGAGACAFERTKMLAGDPSASMIYFDLGTGGDPMGMIPADWDGVAAPLADEPNYFTYYNDWSSGTEDYLKIWQFHSDWATPANSTFTEAFSLVTAPFNSTLCTSGNCVPQPGTAVTLEALTDRLMYRLQYRNFGDHRAMVTNHTVNADGSGRAGVRWYELRNTGSVWSIYQQGTYSPDATHRWMGSIAMNSSGDIALGYSASDATTFPSIRYTGRLAGDPLGQMTFAEQSIIEGTGYQSGSAARWGDYSMMSVDPTDDATFWYTTEYIQTSGTVNWKTRIASFNFAPSAQFVANITKPCLNNTTVFTDQSLGIPTSWSWTVSPATFAFMDATNSTSQNPHIKFTALGNYTIALTVTNARGSNTITKAAYISVNAANADFAATSTSLMVGNPATFNDASTCSISSWSWDFGAGASPATANTLGPHIVSYGSTGQKTVTLTVNGSVTETKTNYINVLPAFSYCTPTYTYGSGDGDYISLVQLGSINNPTGASVSPYYTYYNTMSTDLAQGSPYTITLSPGTYTSGNNISVWIDYNQNGTFETAEKLGNVAAPATPATRTITFTVPAVVTTGLTRMRVREVYNSNSFDACSNYNYGETEDYIINIVAPSKTLNLTVLLEGLFNGTTMNKAKNASADQYSGVVADQVTVELHNAVSPFALAGGPYTVNVNTDGTASVTVPASLGSSYYIVVKHRNSVETWNASPMSFSGATMSYNFSSSAAQAYGSNLKSVSGKFLIFGGDANQDGIVDSGDIVDVDNAASNFLNGYISSDVNGDGHVDSADLQLINANTTVFVGKIVP